MSTKEYNGHTGQERTVSLMPTSSPSSLYRDAFIYKFHNQDGDYVRIVFSELYLTESKAVLKVTLFNGIQYAFHSL